uniref:unspecific monooxygenase n=1 Tax=Streltzoviella insularis TaxID=1206366 RepID=A0A7D5UMT1_9NEOP|nr:cytochrome P450 27 [Streltzoviella insularis]
MIAEILVFVLTTLLVYILYTYKNFHYYLDQRGVKYMPGLPLFGNIYKSMFMRRHMWEDFDAVYKAFPNERYVGFIEPTTLALMIRDPELIKAITIKDFDHFTDHRAFFSEEAEPVLSGNLLLMKGQKWHDMRATLSPAFTSSKMKHMMPFMMEIGENIVEYLKDHHSQDIDLNDIIRRYTNDVIASTGFGLQVNSLKDKDNDFYNIGQNLFKLTISQRLGFLGLIFFPELSKKLKLRVFPEKVTNFFKYLVTSTMEYREKNNVERPDMIQLLMEAYKGTLNHNADSVEKDIGFATTEEALKPQGPVRKWTQDELCGQMFVFFAAGFESTASILVLCLHELTLKPKIQETLYQEIKEFKQKNPNLTYDNISKLKYLDCVVNETLRKWSPAIRMDRICVKPYELPPPREGAQPYRLKPGDIVYNSLNSIHMDPKYYPQPDIFDPDRFSDENKHKIKPLTFIPFGLGPRNCIGSRYALLELKVLLYQLVLNFKILKCAKTSEVVELTPKEFNFKVKGGSWVRMEIRH